MVTVSSEAAKGGVARSPGSPAPGEADQLLTKQVDLLYSHARFGLLGGTLCAVALTYTLRRAVDPVWLYSWLGAVVLATLARGALILKRKRANPGLEWAVRWRDLYIAGAAVSGVIWGVAGGVFFVEGSLADQAFLLLVLGGLSAGAAVVYSPVLPVFTAFTIPAMSPIIARFVASESQDQAIMGVLVSFYLFTTIVIARRLNKVTSGYLELGFENKELADHMAAAKEKAENLNAKLVSEIAERERAEERLRDAASRTEAANRAKSEFLANISHEIRTPLNAIIGMTELALSSELDDEQRECLETALSSSETLLEIVNEVLDFSKIEAGKLEIEQVEFDLRDVVETGAELLAAQACRKGIEMVVFIDPDIPSRFMGDPVRLRMILVNLVGNAIKFTEKGEVEIRARLERQDEDRAVVLFSIRDTGIGIPRDMQEKIFESFTQADGSTTRMYGGTGLGATISKKLVEIMGGRIWLESEPGAGSVFRFTVPLAPLKQDTQTEESLPLPDFSGLRALIVDDNSASGKALAETISRRGGSCICLESGEKAVRTLKEAVDAGAPFDLCLIDSDMPGVAGAEVAGMIKSEPGLDKTRIIMLVQAGTGLGGDEPGAGSLERVAKPVKQRHLYDTIARVMDGDEGFCRDVERVSDGGAGNAGLNVLVAEDNTVNQKVACGMLEKLGHEVTIAANGLEAVRLWRKGRFDVIFMDLQMPGVDGFEAARMIREMEVDRGGRVPIIALTARAIKGERDTLMAAGMDGCITKPVRMKDLAEKLGAGSAGAAGRVDEKNVAGLGGLLDLEELRCAFGDDEIKGLMELFMDSTSRGLAELEESVKRKAAVETEEKAHRLKGSAAQFRAAGMAGLLERLQKAGRKNDFERAGELLSSIKSESERIRHALMREFGIEG